MVQKRHTIAGSVVFFDKRARRPFGELGSGRSNANGSVVWVDVRSLESRRRALSTFATMSIHIEGVLVPSS